MPTIRKEITTYASPTDTWAAIADLGALHTRLVPGFVTDTQLEPGARTVTFANGMQAKELIVDVDAEARRLVWTADLLPAEMKAPVEGMMGQGMVVMKRTLDALAA